MTRYLVAPLEFKGSLTAAEAAEAMRVGLLRGQASAEVDVLPLADGGPGTAEALVAALHGRWHTVVVHDPLGRMVEATYGTWAEDTVGIVEMAQASGLPVGTLSAAALPSLPIPGSRQLSDGVHIAQVVQDPSPPLKRYDPGHPDAGPDGYVSYPDINPLTEMVDLMGATRAYGLNSSAVQAEKGMIVSALDIAKS